MKKLDPQGIMSPSRLGYTLDISHSYSGCRMLMCLVIIDPVQQGDAQMSHPLWQVSAVPELLCGVVVVHGSSRSSSSTYRWVHFQ